MDLGALSTLDAALATQLPKDLAQLQLSLAELLTTNDLAVQLSLAQLYPRLVQTPQLLAQLAACLGPQINATHTPPARSTPAHPASSSFLTADSSSQHAAVASSPAHDPSYMGSNASKRCLQTAPTLDLSVELPQPQPQSQLQRQSNLAYQLWSSSLSKPESAAKRPRTDPSSPGSPPHRPASGQYSSSVLARLLSSTLLVPTEPQPPAVNGPAPISTFCQSDRHTAAADQRPAPPPQATATATRFDPALAAGLPGNPQSAGVRHAGAETDAAAVSEGPRCRRVCPIPVATRWPVRHLLATRADGAGDEAAAGQEEAACRSVVDDSPAPAALMLCGGGSGVPAAAGPSLIRRRTLRSSASGGGGLLAQLQVPVAHQGTGCALLQAPASPTWEDAQLLLSTAREAAVRASGDSDTSGQDVEAEADCVAGAQVTGGGVSGARACVCGAERAMLGGQTDTTGVTATARAAVSPASAAAVASAVQSALEAVDTEASVTADASSSPNPAGGPLQECEGRLAAEAPTTSAMNPATIAACVATQLNGVFPAAAAGLGPTTPAVAIATTRPSPAAVAADAPPGSPADAGAGALSGDDCAAPHGHQAEPDQDSSDSDFAASLPAPVFVGVPIPQQTASSDVAAGAAQVDGICANELGGGAVGTCSGSGKGGAGLVLAAQLGLFDPVRYMRRQECIRPLVQPSAGQSSASFPPWVSRSQFEKMCGSTTAKWYRSIRVLRSVTPADIAALNAAATPATTGATPSAIGPAADPTSPTTCSAEPAGPTAGSPVLRLSPLPGLTVANPAALETLGDWLERQGLPIWKGPNRLPPSVRPNNRSRSRRLSRHPHHGGGGGGRAAPRASLGAAAAAAVAAMMAAEEAARAPAGSSICASAAASAVAAAAAAVRAATAESTSGAGASATAGDVSRAETKAALAATTLPAPMAPCDSDVSVLAAALHAAGLAAVPSVEQQLGEAREVAANSRCEEVTRGPRQTLQGGGAQVAPCSKEDTPAAAELRPEEKEESRTAAAAAAVNALGRGASCILPSECTAAAAAAATLVAPADSCHSSEGPAGRDLVELSPRAVTAPPAAESAQSGLCSSSTTAAGVEPLRGGGSDGGSGVTRATAAPPTATGAETGETAQPSPPAAAAGLPMKRRWQDSLRSQGAQREDDGQAGPPPAATAAAAVAAAAPAGGAAMGASPSNGHQSAGVLMIASRASGTATVATSAAAAAAAPASGRDGAGEEAGNRPWKRMRIPVYDIFPMPGSVQWRRCVPQVVATQCATPMKLPEAPQHPAPPRPPPLRTAPLLAAPVAARPVAAAAAPVAAVRASDTCGGGSPGLRLSSHGLGAVAARQRTVGACLLAPPPPPPHQLRRSNRPRVPPVHLREEAADATPAPGQLQPLAPLRTDHRGTMRLAAGLRHRQHQQQQPQTLQLTRRGPSSADCPLFECVEASAPAAALGPTGDETEVRQQPSTSGIAAPQSPHDAAPSGHTEVGEPSSMAAAVEAAPEAAAVEATEPLQSPTSGLQEVTAVTGVVSEGQERSEGDDTRTAAAAGEAEGAGSMAGGPVCRREAAAGQRVAYHPYHPYNAWRRRVMGPAAPSTAAEVVDGGAPNPWREPGAAAAFPFGPARPVMIRVRAPIVAYADEAFVGPTSTPCTETG